MAYCAKQTHLEELRTLANSEVILLISEQEDFLLFINYCAKISVILRGDNHLNFGHGMCRMIEKWYEKFSPIQLANMFGEHRSLHGWTHQSVIRKAHMRTKELTPPGAQAQPETNPEINSTISAAVPLQKDEDREHVFHFIFCKGSQEYLKYLEDKNELGSGAQRLKEIQILKTNENIESAAQSIRRHNFCLEQMPAHLLEKEKIWLDLLLLPKLSSRNLLKYFNTLKDQGFLNKDSPFVHQFIKVFGNPRSFKSENVCPIFLYIHKQLYEKNVRYLGTKKAEYYEKKMLKRKVTTNPVIQERLTDMFHQALFNANPAPAKFFLVIDLRRGNAKSNFIVMFLNEFVFDKFFLNFLEPVLRNKHINCFEASFLLAYSIFTREKDAMVYTFTNMKDKLEPIHTMMPKKNFEMAKEAVDLHTVCNQLNVLRPLYTGFH